MLNRKNLITSFLICFTAMAVTGCGSYEVRYELNGGTVIVGDLVQEVKRGEDAEDPAVEREGYRFAGWDKSTKEVKDDIDTIAQWEKEYTIRFDLNGGEILSGEEEQHLVAGEMPTEPEAILEGMEFEGWDPAVAAVSQDAVYTAKWAKKELSSEEVYEKVKSGVVEIEIYDKDGESEALGSGFFIDDKGTVVTNYHVMKGAYSAKVKTSDDLKYDVKSISYSEEMDIAIIETNMENSEPLTIATDPVAVGETVYAMGSPFGSTGTFTQGTVSKASEVNEENGVDYIQHQAPISSGNSGGPLLNIYAEVVGINTMVLVDAQNMNYAINIKEIDKLSGQSKTDMETFYESTNSDYLWESRVYEFIEPSKHSEKESNDIYSYADRVYMDSWTAAVISDTSDVDWFYTVAETSGNITFEVAPNRVNEADEIIGFVITDIDDDSTWQPLTKSDDYDFTIELVGSVAVNKGDVVFFALTHDDDYELTEPLVYMVQTSQ